MTRNAIALRTVVAVKMRLLVAVRMAERERRQMDVTLMTLSKMVVYQRPQRGQRQRHQQQEDLESRQS